MQPAVPRREPDYFIAGDTAQWKRYFEAYPASQGWFLDYEIRGQGQPISFQSTADGDSHLVVVSAAITGLWVPAKACVLAGYACNNTGGQLAPQWEIDGVYPQNAVVTNNGALYQALVAQVGAAGNQPPNGAFWAVYVPGAQRFNIYYQETPILANLEGSQGDQPVKTFAQQMVEAIEGTLLQTAGDNLLVVRVGDQEFKYESRQSMRREYFRWKTEVRVELAKQRAVNGKPSMSRVIPLVGITPPGPLYGGQYPSSYFGGVD